MKPLRTDTAGMGDDSPPFDDPPGEPVASDGYDPAAAFALLGDATRLRILRELWTAQRDTPEGSVPFEMLRQRAGVDDSGRFNYHLGRLTGRFVDRREDGYRLRFAGTRVVGALLEGTYAPGEETDVSARGDCPDCGTGLRLRYADERVRVECPDPDCGAFVSEFGCPPGLLAGRPAADLPAVVDVHLRSVLARAKGGICPTCSGPTTTRVGRTDDGPNACEAGDPDAPDPPVTLACERCGDLVGTGLPSLLLDRPAVVSFLHDRGIDPDALSWTLLDRLSRESRVVSDDPYRAAVTYRADDDAR